MLFSCLLYHGLVKTLQPALIKISKLLTIDVQHVSQSANCLSEASFFTVIAIIIIIIIIVIIMIIIIIISRCSTDYAP